MLIGTTKIIAKHITYGFIEMLPIYIILFSQNKMKTYISSEEVNISNEEVNILNEEVNISKEEVNISNE